MSSLYVLVVIATLRGTCLLQRHRSSCPRRHNVNPPNKYYVKTTTDTIRWAFTVTAIGCHRGARDTGSGGGERSGLYLPPSGGCRASQTTTWGCDVWRTGSELAAIATAACNDPMRLTRLVPSHPEMFSLRRLSTDAWYDGWIMWIPLTLCLEQCKSTAFILYVGVSVVRTLVFGWLTFPDLCLI